MRSGFTLMEVIVAVAIVAAVAGFSLAMDPPSFIRSSLDAERESLVSILSAARSEAMANIGGADHGVRISPEKYTLFEGPSYAGRNTQKDKDFSPGVNLVLGGASEIVFRSLDGFVSVPGEITMSSGARVASISINQEGMIE